MEFLNKINKKFIEKSGEIENWIEQHSKEALVPLYTSVDLRISKYKITPVDTNVFPAGFNNLSDYYRGRTASLFNQYLRRKYPKYSNILLIPELNTRNLYYWENVYVLKSILESVGFRVEIGIVSDELQLEKANFKSISGKEIQAYKVFKEGYKALIPNYTPDLILVNNDFSSRCPETLRDIIQPVEPPVEIGWHTRKKNLHFELYNKLANELSQIIEIDPWIISIETLLEKGVDFDNPEDRERAAKKVDLLMDKLKSEYNERNIDQDPFLFVKSNSGTYGMAVVNVSSGDELRNLNADGRKRMKVTKGGEPVRDVVIQEGIPTSLRLKSGTFGEPVIYLVSTNMAGAFLRLNRGKSEFENLNARGMEFKSMSLAYDYEHDKEDIEKNLPISCQVIARTASIAAGYEIQRILSEGGCREEAS